MIKWSDIEAEVGGFREGLVDIFKKYEGMVTDEVDSQGRAVKVTMASFSRHMGLAESTFQEWCRKATGTAAARGERAGSWQDREQKAAAKAKAEAEAKAAKALAEALAKQEREARAKAEADRKAQNERHAAEMKAAAEKAKAEKLEALARLEKQMKETAKSSDFDITTLTPQQKAQIMTLLANDPDKAKQWFAAQTAERSRKLAEAEKKAKEDAVKKREQMAEREARKAAERARQDYEGSALKDFVAITKAAKALQAKLRVKPVTFDHVLTSGMSAQEWVSMTELVEDVAVEVRESLFSINAEQELKGVNG